jgi:hypothetical protein
MLWPGLEIGTVLIVTVAIPIMAPNAQAERPALARSLRCHGFMPDRSSLLLDRWSGRQVLESNTAPASEPLPRLCYTPQELGMMLQSIVEPVVLVLESNKHSSRFAMAGDENLLGLC